MKSSTKILNSLLLALFGLFASIKSAVAQIEIDKIQGTLENVPTEARNLVNPIFNILLFIVGIIAAGVLVYGYIQKKRSNDPNSGDSLVSGALNTVYVVVGIYIIKFIFFGA